MVVVVVLVVAVETSLFFLSRKGSAYFSLVEVETEIMFLPQKPLLTTGTLSEQVSLHNPAI